MFCINCGTKLDEGEKFCTSCGARIDEPEAVETAPQVEAPPAETPPVDVALPQETTAKDYKDILTENGLEKYIHTFEENDLTDIAIISELTESELEQIGITSLGAKKKILHAFELKQTPQIVQPQYSQFFNSQTAKLHTHSASLYRKMRPVLHNKKFIYGGIAAAAVILTGVLIFNKAGNDSAYNSGNQLSSTSHNIGNQLSGTSWRCVNKDPSVYPFKYVLFGDSMIILHFSKDKFKLTGAPFSYEGTYTISGDDITLKYAMGFTIKCSVFGNALVYGRNGEFIKIQ